MNLSDVDLFTTVTTQASVSVVAGKKYIGITSGATGFSRTTGSTTTISFEGVTGGFMRNENIALDETPSTSIAQIANTSTAVTDYQFTDCKSFFKTGFTADLILDL